MDPLQTETPSHKSGRKLILAGVAGLLGISLILGALLMSHFGPHILEERWKNQLQAAMDVSKSDAVKGKQMIDQTFSDARAAKVSNDKLMSLYREYAGVLYGEQEKELGDRQLETAISLCPQEPPPQSAEADQLANAYQTRGWDSHLRFLNGTWKDPGDKDQEVSVAVAEKAFGPDHEQTINKIATLALIYADLNQKQKAEELMQRAVTAADTKESARGCAPFVYSLLARMRGVQQDYKSATAAYLHGKKLASSDEQRERLWTEFATGLRQGHPDNNEATVLASALLEKEKFAELDRLADGYRASKAAKANGLWQLDEFYTAVDGARTLDEKHYLQRISKLKKWLAQNPSSFTARIAIAQCDIYNAWKVRVGEDPNRSDLFRDRLKEAQSTMDGDGATHDKDPAGLATYTRLAVAAGRHKEQSLSIVDECNKLWPTYFAIDTWAYYFLLPTWYGNDHDAEDYITSRSDALGGVRGDQEYARLVWWAEDNLPNHFKSKSIKWERVKAGFKQIFKEFPAAMEAKIAYIKLAVLFGDDESAKTAF